MFRPPKLLIQFLFGTKNKKLLNSIIDDTDLDFAQWAIKKLLNWKNKRQMDNVVKISGANDKLLPPKDKRTILIENGGHFMIVDKANEISTIINTRLKEKY